MDKKLYKISFVDYRIKDMYVSATNPDNAYQQARDHLDKHDICFPDGRVMESIGLVASEPKKGFFNGECEHIFLV